MVLQRVLGSIAMLREQAATFEEADDAAGAGGCNAADLLIVRGGQRVELGRARVVGVGINTVEKDS